MFKKLFCRLFHKKKKSTYINPCFTTYVDESLTNKNLRKYDSKALLKAFKKSKIGKTVKILANDKIEIKLKPWDFEKMGISEEQLKEIQKRLIENIMVDFDRQFITGRKSSD
jgi:translation initiation factor IF-1